MAHYFEERERRNSFKNWPKPEINSNLLAQTGFFYLGIKDKVKCNFCGIIVESWKPEDNILQDHREYSPRCPLITGQPTPNIPLNLLEFRYLIPLSSIQQSPDECGSRPLQAVNKYVVNPLKRKHVTFNDEVVQHTNMSIAQERYKTFFLAPSKLQQMAKELADAGFYYRPEVDQIRCFKCAVDLKDFWGLNLDYLFIHRLLSKNCEFLLTEKKAYFDE